MQELTFAYISKVLKQIEDKYHHSIKLGIAGSYANGKATAESDLDVIIDGDSMRLDIAEDIKSSFPIQVDTLWLDLLKKEDDDIDLFCKENDLPINEDSVYKTIRKEVIWIDKNKKYCKFRDS